MKLMFKYHPGIINKLPHEIPSKSILRFYEGREGKYTLTYRVREV
jgi:hypothetical protein